MYRKTAFTKKPINFVSYNKGKKMLERTEHVEQVRVCQWLRHRGVIHCSIPNGVPVTPAQRMWMVAEGMTQGAPDLLIFNKPNKSHKVIDVKGKPCEILYCGVALEMKREFSGEQSEAQKIWEKKLEELGWLYAVKHGSEEAIKWLESLGY